MSVVQACVAAQEAVARARSLFGPAVRVDDAEGSTLIAAAARLSTAARDRTLDMTGGSGMPAYRELVDRTVPPLMTASTSDAELTAQLMVAGGATRAGAERLDLIADQIRAITLDAQTSRSPAAQRAVLTALRSQLQQADQIVRGTQQQGTAVAARIRALRYPPAQGSAAGGVTPLDGPLPEDGPGDIWDPSTAYRLFNSLNECKAWIAFRHVLYPWQQWECHIAGPGGVAGSFIVDKA